MKNKAIESKESKLFIIFVILVLIIILVGVIYKKYKEDSIYNHYYAYATNDWYNVSLRINNKIPAGVATYSTKEEAIAAFPKNHLETKPFLIMHRVNNDVIEESYILVAKNGKYYGIRGGYKANYISDKKVEEIYKQNYKTLIAAFGEESCNTLQDGSYNCESDYELADGKWEIKVQKDGRVRVAGFDAFCVIDKKGTSGCGVTPTD